MLDQLLRLSNVNSTEIQKARDLILALYINMTCYKIPPLGKKVFRKLHCGKPIQIFQINNIDLFYL